MTSQKKETQVSKDWKKIVTVVIDFDDTIAEVFFDKQQRNLIILRPKNGVREALREFQRLGYRVVIFSCRNNPAIVGDKSVALGAISEFMERYNLLYDEIDDGTNGKPYGDYYIDDKGIRFENNWNEIRDRILKENPTNER